MDLEENVSTRKEKQRKRRRELQNEHKKFASKKTIHKTRIQFLDSVQDISNNVGSSSTLHALKGQKKRSQISCREYYCFKLQVRPSTNFILLHAGRLFQQYVVDMYVKIETSRLDYFRQHQNEIRAELYQGIVDSVEIGEHRGCNVGRKIILPSSFTGGPRDMKKRYMDAMALVQKIWKT
ncbi:Helitron helicase-like domain containing protein [Abeliophyllum distichum]|uniref:Helitron helicase-like domain containing protein n=1 Tax=Abeliophyllum distichum TaxID=126358 RepID=A0ABD1NQE9_9LAMI